MSSLSEFIPRQAILLPVLIITGLLLAACTGSAAPTVTDPTHAPTNSESEPGTAEAPPDTPAAAQPEPATTEPAAEAASNESEPASAADPTTTTAAQPTRKPASAYADLEVVTLLPRDAIPAIDNPRFLTAKEADEYYDPDELVMGVSFNGESRAYSAPFLSNHEIVNDTVGGVKIAITW